MKLRYWSLIVLGVGVLALGVLSGSGESVEMVEVCVSTGERPGLFDGCPTVTERRMVESTSQMPLLVGGGVLVVVGLVVGEDAD